MADTTFSAGTVIASPWLNDVNDDVYNVNRNKPYYVTGLVLGTGISNTQQTANGTTINAAIVAANSLGEYVQLPAGRIEFDGSILPLANSEITGHGAGTLLVYYGTTQAIDARGTSGARIPFSFRNCRVTASTTANNAVFAKLGWNQRSLNMFADLEVFGFGGGGIQFTDYNWIVYSHRINIHDCGSNNGGAGIFRDDNIGELADIKFFGCIVEACGKSTSVAGAINMPCTLTRLGGIYWIGGDHEGNFGTSEAFYQNADIFYSGSYQEGDFSDSTPASGLAKNGVTLSTAYGFFTGSRFSSFAPNTGGFAIIANASSVVTVEASCEFDTDYGAGDVQLNNSKLTTTHPTLRVVRTGTGTLVGRGMQAMAWGVFDGKTGSVATFKFGEGVFSVTRNATGTYTIVTNAVQSDLKAAVMCNASDVGTFRGLICCPRPTAAANTFVIDVADDTNTARDASWVSFVIYGMST